jgi:hypothetical protein
MTRPGRQVRTGLLRRRAGGVPFRSPVFPPTFATSCAQGRAFSKSRAWRPLFTSAGAAARSPSPRPRRRAGVWPLRIRLWRHPARSWSGARSRAVRCRGHRRGPGLRILATSCAFPLLLHQPSAEHKLLGGEVPSGRPRRKPCHLAAVQRCSCTRASELARTRRSRRRRSRPWAQLVTSYRTMAFEATVGCLERPYIVKDIRRPSGTQSRRGMAFRPRRRRAASSTSAGTP